MHKYRKISRRFLGLIGAEVKRLLVVSVGLGIVWFLIEYSFIFVFQVFFHSIGILSTDQMKLPFPVSSNVGFGVSALFIYGLIRATVMFFRQYFSGIIAQTFIRNNRELLFSYALNDPKLEAVHSLSSVFSDRVYQTGFAIQNFAQFISTIISLLALFLVGLKLAPLELLFGLGALVILLLPFKRMGSSLAALGNELGFEWNSINKALLVGLKNQYFLRIYGGVGAYVENGTAFIRRYESNFRRYIAINSFKGTLPVAYGILVISVIAYVSRVYWGRDGVTLVSFFYIFMRLSQGAGDLNTALNEMRFHSNNMTDVYKWKLKAHRLLSRIQSKKSKQGENLIPAIELIAAQNICFSYSPSRPVFENLNFEINKGQMLLVKGESGAGKSTLISVLVGLYPPQSGVVNYNQQSLQNWSPSYFDRLAYVGPDPYIVPGTIRDNLLFGHHESSKVTEQEFIDALDLACIKNEVMSLKNGLNENLFENAQLSSGQKQRVSIARALLRRPNVLILDEATANLDTITEGLFLNNIERLKSKMIVIVVSHKPSFDRLADVTLTMGKI